MWARIPPRSRKLLLPFLTVQETLALDTAVAPGQEKERDHLEKAYRGLRSGGFDEHLFSSRNDYESMKWAQKRGIDLWHLKLEYKGERDVDKVLGLLVVDEKEEMARYYAERSDAEDTEVDDEDGDGGQCFFLCFLHPDGGITSRVLGSGAKSDRQRSRREQEH